MNKKHIPITECNEGDILAQGVYSKDGTLMIAENTVINEKIIKKLIDLDITDVLIIKEKDAIKGGNTQDNNVPDDNITEDSTAISDSNEENNNIITAVTANDSSIENNEVSNDNSIKDDDTYDIGIESSDVNSDIETENSGHFNDIDAENISIFGDNSKDDEDASYEDRLKADLENFHKFKNNYIEKVQDVKSTLDNIASGKDMSIDSVKLISESLYNEAMNNHKIIKYICQIKDKDHYTYLHSINVSIYTMMIGKWMGLPDDDIKDLVIAGVLHDIGKLIIPHNTAENNRLISLLEAREVKRHAIYSYLILRNIPDISEKVRQAVLMHHEYENGSGYPLKINGKKINILAKILCVANVYDNLIMNKNGETISPFEALKQLEKMSFGYFDVKVIVAFLSNIIDYYKGTRVIMSDGAVGEVISILPNNISCPIVKTKNKFIFTSTEKEVKIVRVSSEA